MGLHAFLILSMFPSIDCVTFDERAYGCLKGFGRPISQRIYGITYNFLFILCAQ